MIDSKVSDPKLRSIPSDTQTTHPEVRESKSIPPPDAGSAANNEEIAVLAYQYWVERGSPHGSHEEDWYRAEQELANRKPKARTAGA